VLLLLTVPAAAGCSALGGTSAGEIGRLYLVLFLAAVQLSTLALLVSSAVNTTDGALRVTYAFVLLVTVGTLGPYALLQGTGGGAAMLASWVRGLSPIPAVLEVLGQGDVGSQGLTTGAAFTLRYLVLGTASSVACMHVTVARLNHRLLERVRPAGVMTED